MRKELAIGLVMLAGVAGAMGYYVYGTIDEQRIAIEALRADLEVAQQRAEQAGALSARVDEQARQLGALNRSFEELYEVAFARDDEVPADAVAASAVEPSRVPVVSDPPAAEIAARIADDDEVLDKIVARVQQRGFATPSPGGEAVGSLPATEQKEQVKAALAEIRAEEERERDERRRQRFVERTSERVNRYAEALALQPHQAEALTNIYLSSYETRRTMFQQMREGDFSRDDMRDAMRKSQEAQEAEIQKILDPFQYEELQKLQEEDGGDRGWGGRRGRGGQGGGPPSPPQR